jgi:hypothetical protein
MMDDEASDEENRMILAFLLCLNEELNDSQPAPQVILHLRHS